MEEQEQQNIQMEPTPLSPPPSHNKLIIGIVAGFVLVVAGVAGAYFLLQPKQSGDLLSYMLTDFSIWIKDVDNESPPMKIVGALQTDVRNLGDLLRNWSVSLTSNKIVYNEEGGIYITSVDMNSVSEFLHDGENPKWSPTGDAILFEDEEMVKVVMLDSREVREFADVFRIHTPYPWFSDGIHFISQEALFKWSILNKDTGERIPMEILELVKLEEKIVYEAIVSVQDEIIFEYTTETRI